MTKQVKPDFGTVGMALSCTLFLEQALINYRDYTRFIDNETIDIIHKWNKHLLYVLKDSKYDTLLGDTGKKLVQYTSEDKKFITRCITTAKDVTTQSLYYVLRFDESVGFLRDKYRNNPRLTFCDLGVGLSPLPIVFQTQYNIKGIYCIDVVPEIADIYQTTAKYCDIKSPEFIDWESAQTMGKSHQISTIVSVGCLPHIPMELQKKYLQSINALFDYFFIEIKYATTLENKEKNDKAFCLHELQKLRMDVKNVTDVESEMIHRAIRYLRNFIRAKPNRIDFVSEYRSLFLSR